jgi:predicted transcriptional regulator YdeE
MRTFVVLSVLLVLFCLSACQTETAEQKQIDVPRAEVTKLYHHEVPSLKFIGKRYGFEDSDDGMFSHLWDEWFDRRWFDVLDKYIDLDLINDIDDIEAKLGLLITDTGEPFEYWIGRFAHIDSDVPTGFSYLVFQNVRWLVAWVHGFEPDIYWQGEVILTAFEEKGYTVASNIIIERYAHSRFTNPDEHGRVTLDLIYLLPTQD